MHRHYPAVPAVVDHTDLDLGLWLEAGLSLLHVACTARIACKWVRESRLCSQNTTLPPYARRVRKPSPLIVRQGSRRLASRNVSRRPSEAEPSPERVRWPRMSLFPQITTGEAGRTRS